jgi:hypothetical protein
VCILTLSSLNSVVDAGLCTLSTDTIAAQELGDVVTNATSSGLPLNGNEMPVVVCKSIPKLNKAGMPSHATNISLS